MNSTVAGCGHKSFAVGAPGSQARYECEHTPCEQCLAEERDALAGLLRSHPDYGTRALTVRECLDSCFIDRAVKYRYTLAFERNNQRYTVGDKVRRYTYLHGWRFGRIIGTHLDSVGVDPTGLAMATVRWSEYGRFPQEDESIAQFLLERCI